MSRLYDRALSKGCRPLTFWDLYTGYSQAQSAEGRDPDLSAKIALQEDGVEITPEAIAEVNERMRRNTQQYVRSNTVYRHTELEPATVLVANDVGHYFESFPEGTRMGDLLSTVAPPLDDMWIEFDRVPNRLSLRSWGVHLAVADGPGIKNPLRPAWAPAAARWIVAFTVLGEWTKGDIVGPVAGGAICVDQEGTLVRDQEGHPVVRLNLGGDDVLEARMDADHVDFYRARAQELLYAALLAVSFCHCKNVDRVEVEPEPKLSRAFRRRQGRPLTRYWVLDIEPMKRVLDRDGDARSKGLSHALHVCRGHFKTFTADAPLFGKVTGTYWWGAQLRGSAEHGSITKDYRIRIDPGELGRPYEPVNEHQVLPAEPEGRSVDPDHTGRGLVAHNRTQNILAGEVESAGYQPRRPKPTEPQYDLAWETLNAVWLAEVKSLTDRNELRQMHTAIGQLLDYAHRLDAGDRQVRLVIALERPPSAPHWVEECAKHGIVIAWPATFAETII